MKKSYVDLRKALKRFHEVVEAYTGDGNLGYNSNDEVTNQKGDFSKIRQLKKKSFENTVLAIVISTALGAGAGIYAGVNSGYKRGYNDGYESGAIDESQVSNLKEEDKNYTIDTAPDIVILKYLDYAVDVNPDITSDYNETNEYYEAYKKQVVEELKNKENSDNYIKFREGSKNIAKTISFDRFEYSIAFDEEGNMIKDNTSSYYIDNENCSVYIPTYKKVDSNDLNDGEFIKDGILYVDIDNPSSLYYKGR